MSTFGGLAVMSLERDLDPWLCVPIFRWVCSCRVILKKL